MFKPTITVRSLSELPYGSTQVPKAKTFGQIMEIFDKLGCTKAMSMNDRETGQQSFAFELDGHAHLIRVPRVRVQNRTRSEWVDDVGIRIVYWFLKSLLPLLKDRRITDARHILAGARVIQTADGTTTVGEMMALMEPEDIFPRLGTGNVDVVQTR